MRRRGCLKRTSCSGMHVTATAGGIEETVSLSMHACILCGMLLITNKIAFRMQVPYQLWPGYDIINNAVAVTCIAVFVENNYTTLTAVETKLAK